MSESIGLAAQDHDQEAEVQEGTADARHARIRDAHLQDDHAHLPDDRDRAHLITQEAPRHIVPRTKAGLQHTGGARRTEVLSVLI